MTFPLHTSMHNSPLKTLLALAGAFLLLASAAPARAAERDSVRVLYFGNSLTGNTMPSLQADMGKTAGKTWVCDMSGGAGWQAWMHWINRVYLPEKAGKPSEVRQLLENGKFDAIVIQVFGKTKLVELVDEKFGKVKLGETLDTGDINSSAELIKIYLAKNPNGLVYLYGDWPSIPAKLDDKGKPIKEKTPGDGAGFDVIPDRDAFDYSRVWDTPYSETQEGTAYRAYDEKVLAGLRERFPDLAAAGRLRLIPAGEVLYTLDQQFKAGKAPAGFPSIPDFYTDGTHFRAGVPRYVVLATFFATLFEADPAKLDYSLYNDIASYASKRNGSKFYVHQPDLGDVMTITPEYARYINGTVWNVVTSTPATGVKPAGTAKP